MTLRHRSRVMGCDVDIVLHDEDRALLWVALRMLDDLESRWSRFRPDSEISRLNNADGATVLVSPDTYGLIAASVDGWELTDGAFDPTVYDAVIAAGYDRSYSDRSPAPSRPDRRRTPTNATVAAPGCSGILFDPVVHGVTLPAGVRFDPGGIGKGAAADRVSGALMRYGARGVGISIGGDMRVRGASPTHNGWTVVDDESHETIAVLADGAVCTSGTQRRRLAGGHHLIDPATGAPTDEIVTKATVVAGTAQQAEILAKAAVVNGVQAPLWMEHFQVSALIRFADGTTMSTGRHLGALVPAQDDPGESLRIGSVLPTGTP